MGFLSMKHFPGSCAFMACSIVCNGNILPKFPLLRKEKSQLDLPKIQQHHPLLTQLGKLTFFTKWPFFMGAAHKTRHAVLVLSLSYLSLANSTRSSSIKIFKCALGISNTCYIISFLRLDSLLRK